MQMSKLDDVVNGLHYEADVRHAAWMLLSSLLCPG